MSRADAKIRNAKIDAMLDELYEPKAIAATVNCAMKVVYERMWDRRLHKIYVTAEEKLAIRQGRVRAAST